MSRPDGRANDALRPVRISPGFLSYPEGSALIEIGATRVLCAVTLNEAVPPFLRGRGQGWLTAEYALLPRSTLTRTPREAALGRVGGRTHEIQRLIGRSLRAALDLETLGERTLILDCDVLQADGGTRTAAITGGFVAVALALRTAVRRGLLAQIPLRTAVAAVSVGLVNGEALLDLCYQEDARAATDFNVVMTAEGEFVEVQGTAESHPFRRPEMLRLLDLAEKGVRELLVCQQQALGQC